MQEEIFGPILPILAFDTLEEALELLRRRPTPLALYLFAQDRQIQERVLASARSGGVCLNDTVTHMVGRNLPFGGLGESWLGAYHGKLVSTVSPTGGRSCAKRLLLIPGCVIRHPASRWRR